MHAPKDNQKRTLDRVLSKFGVGSRTEARSWIGAGRVTVNGKKVQTPDVWIDPEHDIVLVWHWHENRAVDGMIQRIVASATGS